MICGPIPKSYVGNPTRASTPVAPAVQWNNAVAISKVVSPAIQSAFVRSDHVKRISGDPRCEFRLLPLWLAGPAAYLQGNGETNVKVVVNIKIRLIFRVFGANLGSHRSSLVHTTRLWAQSPLHVALGVVVRGRLMCRAP